MSVQDTLSGLTAAWNAGDGTAYGDLFTPDATYVTFEGSVLNGRDEIARVHQFLFDGPLRGSRMGDMNADVRIRDVADGVAVAVTGGAVALDGQDAPPPDRASVQTFVLVENGGTWLVAAFQNTRDTAAA